MSGNAAPTVLARLTMEAPVIIRVCRAEDLADLEWFGMYTHHRQIFGEAFARQASGDNVMLVADLNGFPVGQAWIDLAKHAEQRVGYVWAVRVFPFLRGLGIGSQLMWSAEEILRERGFDGAEVGVEKENPDARRLYERLGYVVDGAVSEEYGYTTPDGQSFRHVVDQWILRKWIRG